MKKFLSLVLALVMTMSLVVVSASATEFEDFGDVKSIEHPEAVEVLNKIGVITGYEDGSFHPFHIYSMRQAIQEGFILDVLQNYMTYDTCFKIAKTTEDNPDVPSSRAAKIIRKYPSGRLSHLSDSSNRAGSR